jgi:hypothetical protein
MLNPSDADADNDDPTVRRLIHFSEAHGYGGLMIANLVPYITSDPKKMLEWVKFTDYHLGNTNYHYRLNLKVLSDSIRAVGRKNVIFAWGATGDNDLLKPIVSKFVGIYGQHSKMFGLTKSLQPKHPLYLPNDSRLELFPYHKKKW